MSIHYFTSESVTEGHPDKICDQISDHILDGLLKHDPESCCACETTVEPGAVHIMGEITSTTVIDYEACAREIIRSNGYTKDENSFTDRCSFSNSIHTQSTIIAMGVNEALESREMEDSDISVDDQVMMFGYACSDDQNAESAQTNLSDHCSPWSFRKGGGYAPLGTRLTRH